MVGANSSGGFSSYEFCGFSLYYSLCFTAKKAIKLQFFHIFMYICCFAINFESVVILEGPDRPDDIKGVIIPTTVL